MAMLANRRGPESQRDGWLPSIPVAGFYSAAENHPGFSKPIDPESRILSRCAVEAGRKSADGKFPSGRRGFYRSKSCGLFWKIAVRLREKSA